MANQLTEEEITEFKEAFSQFGENAEYIHPKIIKFTPPFLINNNNLTSLLFLFYIIFFIIHYNQSYRRRSL